MQANQNPRYWVCLIGPVENDRLPADADFSPRRAAVRAIIDMSGVDPDCSSAWCDEAEYRKTRAARALFAALKELWETCGESDNPRYNKARLAASAALALATGEEAK